MQKPNVEPQSASASPLTVNGAHIETIVRGSGRPLLFLHPELLGTDLAAPAIERLAAKARVIAPSHPGFGCSDLPKEVTTVDDLAYFYLDLMDQLDLRDAAVVGVSMGAWIAAEIAVKSTARISHLVLANAIGIKVSGRETRDIADMFAIAETRFAELAYHDPALGKRDIAALSDDQVRIVARNREATARFGWSPYMHNPKLKARLHRIRGPTLVLWGASDRVVGADYGRAYAAAIPGAKFETIERAGHFPHVEQPDELAGRVLAFIGTKT